MKRGLPTRLGLLLGLFVSAISGAAQSSEPSLDSVIQQAAIIFAGRVKPIEQPNDSHSNYVVVFSVTDGIRGARSGDEFRMQEWSGLWGTHDRYRLGESLVLMLHKLDANGVTSAIGGRLGRIEINESGSVKLNGIQRRAISRSLRLSRALSESQSHLDPAFTSTGLLRALREVAINPAGGTF